LAIERPDGRGRTEQVSLDSAAKHLLEECRMVLPGIQALFGFQLIAVFNDGFEEKLSGPQQLLHYAAIVLITIAIALVMAPAAIHRQTSQREVSERFIWRASQFLLASMLPLAVAVSLEVYLVGVVIGLAEALAIAWAALILAAFLCLWMAFPLWERRHTPRQKR
jgi:cyanate permease